ncbi:aldehyde dehydrogenase family protein [Gaopeijia maritima]|uniref:Aldehyde dehydrogenase family protein n=1 Tax=Gaopeijia maritima TaxID=3119007 RepID=A0ABU9E8G7_9BACT
MSHEVRTRLWIHNEEVDAASGLTFETTNPATGATIASVARGAAADIDRAVASAREAMASPEWRGMDAHKRARLMWRLADLIQENADELGALETRDNGKPYFEARKVDLPSVVENFRYFAGLADKIGGETIPVSGPFLNYTMREPVGVVGAIVPWNFPLSLAAWKVAPALACGNAVILKPAEQTPLTAIRLGELAAEAGFPPGVLNVVPGFGHEAGAALVAHPGVDTVAFTGSTEVGRIVARSAADTLKKVSLELGGKSPNIIFADADLKAAIRGAGTGIFYGKGEVCAAGSRILVERPVYDEFVSAFAARAEKTTVGDPMDAGTRLGAIVSEEQLERVLGYVEAGRSDGARLVAGGERTSVDGKGNFVTATVFADVDQEMTIAREEIFGPVAAVIPFDGVEEAIAIANATEYGLASGVWTRDAGKALRVARDLQAGTVWVNTYNQYDSGSPFGGYKSSGYGRDLGVQAALDKYTQTKSVWVAVDG